MQKMDLVSCKFLCSLRRFYFLNGCTLMNSCIRPFWYGVGALLLEAYYILFGMMNSSVISKLILSDPNLTILNSISMAQKHVFQPSTILLIFLILNGFLVLLITGFYIIFIFKEFRNKKNLFVSFIVKLYISLFFIPSLYYSLKVGGVSGYLNFPLTVFLGNHQINRNIQLFYIQESEYYLLDK